MRSNATSARACLLQPLQHVALVPALQPPPRSRHAAGRVAGRPVAAHLARGRDARASRADDEAQMCCTSTR